MLSKVIQIILAYISTFMQMTCSYFHLTHWYVTEAFEVKSCLDDVKKWLSTNMLKLNSDKTEFFSVWLKDNACKTFMQMTHSYVHLTPLYVTEAFDRLKICLDDVKKCLCANMLKLNSDRTDFFMFRYRIMGAKLFPSFSQCVCMYDYTKRE